MKHLRKFNEHNNAEVNIRGIKCDSCDYNDENVPFSDYPKWVNKPCPECGENLLTQADYDSCLKMVNAVDIINSISAEDLDKFAASLTPDDIDGVLDAMNQMKFKKTGEDEHGREVWNIGNLPKNENIEYEDEDDEVPVSKGYSKSSSSNFKVVFDGFETEEQAEAFADWYEGSGEQDSEMWVQEHSDLYCVNVDMKKYHKQGGFKANKKGEIIVPLTLYKRTDDEE